MRTLTIDSIGVSLRLLSKMIATALLCAGLGAIAKAKPLIGVALVDDGAKGAKILRVRPGFPADRAGLRAGDYIVGVNETAPKTARAAAAAIAAATDAPAKMRVARRGKMLDVTISPWVTPNPKLDAELFPYPDPKSVKAGTALKARIAERDYEIVSSAAVFTMARSFGADESFKGRRIAFRARVDHCGHLAGAPKELAQPSSSPLYSFPPAQSLLFDPAAAAAERAKCDAYMKKHELDLSSPIVVIAARLTIDDKKVFSKSGGPVMLIDAMLFDNRHVTLGEQVLGVVELVEPVIRMLE
ncbi:MAG: PDZ domain-containing protein [Neomegalonema sp.]|nr:PDZ domain-containing protein [Neomegalonema sp.]